MIGSTNQIFCHVHSAVAKVNSILPTNAGMLFGARNAASKALAAATMITKR